MMDEKALQGLASLASREEQARVSVYYVVLVALVLWLLEACVKSIYHQYYMNASLHT